MAMAEDATAVDQAMAEDATAVDQAMTEDATAVDHPDATHDEAIATDPDGGRNRWEKLFGITEDVLKLHFDKSFGEAAKALNVSQSTLGRACKALSIGGWPRHYRKRQDFKRRQTVKRVKVAFGNYIIALPLTYSSTLEDLRNELGSKIENFEKYVIEYKDDEDDWIVLFSDSDLKYCMDTSRLWEGDLIRMRVLLKSSKDEPPLPSPTQPPQPSLPPTGPTHGNIGSDSRQLIFSAEDTDHVTATDGELRQFSGQSSETNSDYGLSSESNSDYGQSSLFDTTDSDYDH